MKYKVAIFISATALVIGLYFVYPAQAASHPGFLVKSSANMNNFMFYFSYSNDVTMTYNPDPYSSNGRLNLSFNPSTIYIANIRYSDYNIVSEASLDAWIYAFEHDLIIYGTSGSNNKGWYPIICMGGTAVPGSGYTPPSNNVFDSLDDYNDFLHPQPTWWEKIKTAWDEFCNSRAGLAALTGDWITYLDEVLFGELWSVQVGEGEDDLVQFFTVSATPSPSPSPTPTQIPVQVNIDPSTGNVSYNYTIIVSGTPIPTSSPVNPNPPNGSGGDGGGSGLTEPIGVEDYYEPDDSLSLPNLRIFQFKLNLPGTETDIGVDSLDNNFVVMNEYLEDNAEAITTVSSFFQVIPSEWFLLLGAIACFPIIAAMIKSLLGG